MILRGTLLLLLMTMVLCAAAVGLGRALPYEGTLVQVVTESEGNTLVVTDLQRAVDVDVMQRVRPDRGVVQHNGAPHIILRGEARYNLATFDLQYLALGPTRHVSWSPDSNRVIIENLSRELNAPMRLVDVVTGDTTLLDPVGRGPLWSPAGTPIVYRVVADGATHLHTLDPATQTTQPLIRDLRGVRWMAWSPDGRYMTVVRLDNRRTGIQLIAMDGSSRLLSSLVPTNWVAAWSPDSRYLAFSGVDDETRGIFVVDTTDASVRRVSGDLRADDTPLFWSPDSQWLAFTSRSSGVGERELFVVRADGGDLRQLSDDLTLLFSLVWSPRSDEVLYSAFDAAYTGTDIVRVNLATDERTRVHRPGRVDLLAWLP